MYVDPARPSFFPVFGPHGTALGPGLRDSAWNPIEPRLTGCDLGRLSDSKEDESIVRVCLEDDAEGYD